VTPRPDSNVTLVLRALEGQRELPTLDVAYRAGLDYRLTFDALVRAGEQVVSRSRDGVRVWRRA